jgi:NAD(P)-dependent dehydrogenase (short-subunit alcohol dehydrogenase family)
MAEGSAAVLFSSSGAHIMGPIFDEQIAEVKTPEAVATLSAIATDGYLAYGIAKRAIQVLAQRESFAFAQRGARIVSISPGIIDTPMGRREMEANPIMQTMIKNSAIGRAGRAEEVAAVAVFLCSPAASFVTGVDIHVEGGSFAAERPIGQWKSGE